LAYPIGEVLFLALCSIISSYDDFTDMEMFAVKKAKWLSGYIPMVNGAPSQDVFRNVLSIIELTAMQDILAAWLPSRDQLRQICIDGKAPCAGARCPVAIKPWSTCSERGSAGIA
jgi:DDE_Tnp_1-associated